MAPPRPKPNNLAILIRAIAEAYHRDANGRPIYQQIAFRTGGVLSSATVHLWKHGGVKSVTGVKVHALVNAYDLDFAKVLSLVYGAPTKLSGDELLASLRPEISGQGVKRVRPISGGSHAGATLPVAERARIAGGVLGEPLPVATCPPGRSIMSAWAHRLAYWWGLTLWWDPIGPGGWACA